MTTPVNRSTQVLYNTDQTASCSTDVFYNVNTVVSAPSFVAQYNVLAGMSKSVDLYFNALATIAGKVVNLLFNAYSTLSSRSYGLSYNVMVPVASPPSASLLYNDRSQVTKSVGLVHNVLSTYPLTLSKSVDLYYHTLVTPNTNEIYVVPAMPDSIPPQIVTTSSY